MKGNWFSTTRFSWEFLGQHNVVVPASLADACSFWNGLKDHFPLHIQVK